MPLKSRRIPYPGLIALTLCAVFAALSLCTPIDESRRKGEIDQRVGFLSEHAFQVKCALSYERPEELLALEFQERFREKCDQEMLKALAIQKIKIDFNQRQKQKPGQKKKRYQVKINWNDQLLDLLRSTYGDLLEGRFVRQTRLKKQVEGLYRIEKKMLVEQIRERKLPFQLEIALN